MFFTYFCIPALQGAQLEFSLFVWWNALLFVMCLSNTSLCHSKGHLLQEALRDTYPPAELF